jgi:hypothetical protein
VHVLLLLLAVGQQASLPEIAEVQFTDFGIVQNLVVEVQGTVERITRITLIDAGLVCEVFEKGSANAWHGKYLHFAVDSIV